MKTLLANREARLTFFVTLLFFIAFYTLIVPLPRYLAGVGLHGKRLGRDAFRVEPGVVGHAVDDARAKGAGAVQRVGEALGNPLQIAGVNG